MARTSQHEIQIIPALFSLNPSKIEMFFYPNKIAKNGSTSLFYLLGGFMCVYTCIYIYISSYIIIYPNDTPPLILGMISQWWPNSFQKILTEGYTVRLVKKPGKSPMVGYATYEWMMIMVSNQLDQSRICGIILQVTMVIIYGMNLGVNWVDSDILLNGINMSDGLFKRVLIGMHR